MNKSCEKNVLTIQLLACTMGIVKVESASNVLGDCMPRPEGDSTNLYSDSAVQYADGDTLVEFTQDVSRCSLTNRLAAVRSLQVGLLSSCGL